MNTPSTAALALLALSVAPTLAQAGAPAPNDGMRYVSVGAQADSQHDQQAMSALSLTVGQNAWVQAGAGKARDSQAAGGRKPGIVNVGAGVAGQAAQLTVSATHRADGDKYRQTDVASSLDWKHDGNVVGVDVTHRSSRTTGTVVNGSATVAAQARVSGTGFGVHGTLQASERVSLYGAVARNHYRSVTTQTASGDSGGLLGPVITRALLGGASAVNRDEAVLDHSALVGAAYRFDKVGVSAEYTTGQVHDSGGTLRSVALKAAVDVAPGWRVTPGVGRGSSAQGGQTTFASLAATYGW